MKHTLMLAAVGAIMTVGYGTEAEAQEKTHCVAQAISTARGQALPAGIAPPPVSCFETFAEAISHATKGSVQLGPQATVNELKGSDMQAAGVAAVEYDYYNLMGASLTINANSTCAAGDLWVASLPTTWDNRISSAVLYDSSCSSFLHFTEPNFGGVYGNCGSGCNFGGSLDNNTSSIYLSYYYY